MLLKLVLRNDFSREVEYRHCSREEVVVGIKFLMLYYYFCTDPITRYDKPKTKANNSNHDANKLLGYFLTAEPISIQLPYSI